jgi:hypothetical protein
MLELRIDGSTSLIVSDTAHWPAALRDHPPIHVPLANYVRQERFTHKRVPVSTWLTRVVDAALDGRVDSASFIADACACFQIRIGDSARLFHALVTPQATENKTLVEVLEEAVLPRLAATLPSHLMESLSASVSVPTIILCNWADMKRTDEYLLPKASALGHEGLLSSVRGARSTVTKTAKRQRSPTGEETGRPTSLLAASSPHDDVGAAKQLKFAASVMSPALGPLGSPTLPIATHSPPTHIMPAPHYPTPVPASLPATELKVLNNWIQSRRLPKVHFSAALLCQVCGLMPTSPVIATCCGSTQCRACSNPSAPPVAQSSKITCANCGEERFASEVLPPNHERAAAVTRWMKDIAVLYREELAEMSRGILPITLTAPHQQAVLEAPTAPSWGGPPGSRHILYAPPPPPSSFRAQQGGVAMAGAPPPPGFYQNSSSVLPLSPHSPQARQW